jgi:hypothetical protein
MNDKGVEVELTSIDHREPFPLISTNTNRSRLLGEPATKQKVKHFKVKAAVILSLIAALLLKNPFHGSTANTATATFLSSTRTKTKEESAKTLSYGVPFVIVTEGGCSGTTALGKYIRSIVHRHGFNKTENVSFEFLSPQKSISRNHYFHDIVHERNITTPKKGTQDFNDLIQESVQRAQTVAIKTRTPLFFKANIQRYLELRSRFKALGHVSYVGFYRENLLDRCICMIRDCFYEAKSFGIAVFGKNGTDTDICINRRHDPEWDVQAKVTNAESCLEEDQKRVDLILDQDFDSFTDNKLFQFEKSMSDTDLQVSVDAWVNFLQPLLQGALDPDIVASVLREGRGTHKPSSQESKVYNYMELKEELIGSKWDSFLHD